MEFQQWLGTTQWRHAVVPEVRRTLVTLTRGVEPVVGGNITQQVVDVAMDVFVAWMTDSKVMTDAVEATTPLGEAWGDAGVGLKRRRR